MNRGLSFATVADALEATGIRPHHIRSGSLALAEYVRSQTEVPTHVDASLDADVIVGCDRAGRETFRAVVRIET